MFTIGNVIKKSNKQTIVSYDITEIMVKTLEKKYLKKINNFFFLEFFNYMMGNRQLQKHTHSMGAK